MKLPEFINNVASKSEKQDDPAVVDILSRADIQNINIADDVANGIINGLLTVETAKSHPVVKKHFYAQCLAPYDAEILNTVKKFELGDDFEAEISGNKNTFDKFRKLNEKLKELTDGLKTSQGKGDEKTIEKYVKLINDRNAEIARLKESTVPKTEFEKAQKEKENEIRDFMIHSKIEGLKFANQDVSADVNTEVANVLLKKALLKNKAVIVKEGNDLKLKNAEDPNLDFLNEQNKTVSFDDFTNKVFAESKILAVSGNKNPNTQSFAPPANPFIPELTGKLNTARFDAAVQASLSDLANC
ncbi:MAG: hypothetical protein FWF53_06865 [Candidatus Azobacteroides sp.]|nr:hypothetical protein [Candidatus Azobacteroides sp.]